MVKSGKPGLKTRKVWLVQPGLHPGKPWFNQAFGARETFTNFTKIAEVTIILLAKRETL